jgi:hypothetical protein
MFFRKLVGDMMSYLEWRKPIFSTKGLFLLPLFSDVKLFLSSEANSAIDPCHVHIT